MWFLVLKNEDAFALRVCDITVFVHKPHSQIHSSRGNYMGQYPFTPGQSCELCDSGEVCRNRICSKQGGRGKPYRQNYLPYRSSRTYQSRRVTTWGSEAGRSEARGSEERGRESWGRPQQYSNTGEGMSETASEASEL